MHLPTLSHLLVNVCVIAFYLQQCSLLLSEGELSYLTGNLCDKEGLLSELKENVQPPVVQFERGMRLIDGAEQKETAETWCCLPILQTLQSRCMKDVHDWTVYFLGWERWNELVTVGQWRGQILQLLIIRKKQKKKKKKMNSRLNFGWYPGWLANH